SDAIRWLKVDEAADRARCGPKTIYRAVQSGQLRAARIGSRRELKFLASWIDCWLIGEERRLGRDSSKEGDATAPSPRADEEEQLLRSAEPHLQAVIIAALEISCREGELLSLRWGNISLERGEIILRAENTKDRENRILPISSRLRNVLEMR